MPPLTLEQQLTFARLAVQFGWIRSDDLMIALHCWTSGSLIDFLLQRGLLTPEQVRQLAGDDTPQPKTVGSGSDAFRERQERQPLAAPPSGPARYSRLRSHARGGLGEVFVARDEELQREVALKEIQEFAADDRLSRMRFVREAEITGNLEHPGIVPVYGLGTYPDGRPYYAMRLIRGQSLQQAIQQFHHGKREPLFFRQLLHRFVAVCNAVGFAHSRGVIHRDIKPPNVMLGDYGETLLVDWGLARILEQDEDGTLPTGWMGKPNNDDNTAPTREGQALGTPSYMPPEQARGHLKEVGASSDVFSLGATLYAILTGQAPYRGEEALIQAAACEWKPACQVMRNVPRAMEAICARAMATEPGQRYGSARELAEDVEAWLADEPVAVYREPALDRLRRWGRKHRTLVSSGVVLLLVGVVGLIVGLGAVSAEQTRTAKQRDEAIRNEQRALKAEKEAKENLKLAEENLTLAKKVVLETLNLAKTHPLFNNLGMSEVRKLLLEKALTFYKKFWELKRDDVRSRAELVEQLFIVGSVNSQVGNKTESRKAYEEAQEILRPLVKEYPKVAEYRYNLARVLINQGTEYAAEGKRVKALGSFEQARTLLKRLAEENPEEPVYLSHLGLALANLGVVQKAEGKRTEALKLLTEASSIQQALARKQPGNPWNKERLVSTLLLLGSLLHEEGKSDEALKTDKQGVRLAQELVTAEPRVITYQANLARALINLGSVLNEMGKQRDALASFDKAVSILQYLVEQDPRSITWQEHLALAWTNAGIVLTALGEHSRAIHADTQGRTIWKSLANRNPKDATVQANLGGASHRTGLMLEQQGRFSEALNFLVQARDIQEKLVKEHPRDPTYRNDLARTFHSMGSNLLKQEKHAEATTVIQQAVTSHLALVKEHPKIPLYRASLATTLGDRGNLLANQGKLSQALKAYEQSRDILLQLVKEYPLALRYKQTAALTWYNIGNLLAKDGKGNEALKAYTQARPIYQHLVKDRFHVAANQYDLARTFHNIGVLHHNARKFTEALKNYTQARDLFAKLAKQYPTTRLYHHELLLTLNNMAGVFREQGEQTEALKIQTKIRDLSAVQQQYNQEWFALAQALINVGAIRNDVEQRTQALSAFAEASDILRRLLRYTPHHVVFQRHLAMVSLNMGVVYRGLKRPSEALIELDLALNQIQAALKITPLAPEAVDLRWRIYSHRARALTDLKQHTEAAADWGRVVSLGPFQARSIARVYRAESLARAGRMEQALTEAESLADIPKLSAPFAYKLAGIAALCHGAFPKDATRPLPFREHAARRAARLALRRLQQANEAGFFATKSNRDQVLNEPDLDSLRNRDDFKNFMKTLTPVD